MVKFDSVLNESETYRGNVNYLPNTINGKMYVRVDWNMPVNEQILIAGEEFQIYRPKLNQVLTGRVNSASTNKASGGILSFIKMTSEELKLNFSIALKGEEVLSDGIIAHTLELTPKTLSFFKSADIWVDGDGMPRQVRVNEKNGDTTTVLLSAIQKNMKVEPSVFKLALPKNVKIIKV